MYYDRDEQWRHAHPQHEMDEGVDGRGGQVRGVPYRLEHRRGKDPAASLALPWGFRFGSLLPGFHRVGFYGLGPAAEASQSLEFWLQHLTPTDTLSAMRVLEFQGTHTHTHIHSWDGGSGWHCTQALGLDMRYLVHSTIASAL